VAPVKWRSGLRDLPNAVLVTRECGNSRDSSLGHCIEVIQTVTDPLTRISVAIQQGRSPEAMNSRPRGQLASVSSTQSNRLMSLKDEIPPAEDSPSQVSRYFDYPPTYSNHPRRCASSIPLQTGIPVTPAFGFRIPTPRSEILQVVAPDPYKIGVAPVRAEAGKLYFTKVVRLLLDSRSEHPRGLASLASALGLGEYVDSPRILEVLYVSIEY
jgi:hypothetical protein